MSFTTHQQEFTVILLFLRFIQVFSHKKQPKEEDYHVLFQKKVLRRFQRRYTSWENLLAFKWEKAAWRLLFTFEVESE